MGRKGERAGGESAGWPGQKEPASNLAEEFKFRAAISEGAKHEVKGAPGRGNSSSKCKEPLNYSELHRGPGTVLNSSYP